MEKNPDIEILQNEIAQHEQNLRVLQQQMERETILLQRKAGALEYAIEKDKEKETTQESTPQKKTGDKK